MKLRTLSPPPSSAPCEAGEATTCTLSDTDVLGVTRRPSVVCSASTLLILRGSYQIAKLTAHALESTVRVLARQRGLVVRSSPARDLATVLGRRPRPLGMRVAISHPVRLAPAGARTAHFLSPAVVLARRRHEPRESATSLSTRHPRLNRHLSRARECAGAR